MESNRTAGILRQIFQKGVYISAAYADKFLEEPGDKITLKEKYEEMSIHLK